MKIGHYFGSYLIKMEDLGRRTPIRIQIVLLYLWLSDVTLFNFLQYHFDPSTPTAWSNSTGMGHWVKGISPIPRHKSYARWWHFMRLDPVSLTLFQSSQMPGGPSFQQQDSPWDPRHILSDILTRVGLLFSQDHISAELASLVLTHTHQLGKITKELSSL